MKKNKILSFFTDLILVLVILTAVIITVVSLNTGENGIPNLNGYMPFSIQSNSMKKTLYKGDLIIDKKVDTNSLKVGDVISFLTKENETTIIVTHRILEIKEEGGFKSFITKGDNNPLPDVNEVSTINVVGIYTGNRVPYLGTIIDFLKSQIGFLLCIIVPLFVVFIYQLYKFIGIIIDQRKKDLIEEAKRELIKEQENNNMKE